VITLVYLLIGSFWFQSWYVLWVLVLAALLPSSTWTQWLLPFYSLGALWSNLTTDFGNRAPGVTALTVNRLMVATLLTPLLCVAACLLARRLMRAKSARSGVRLRDVPARYKRLPAASAALRAQNDK
jgi:hypothetical protein